MFLALGDLVLGMLAASVPIVGAIRGHAIGAGKTLFSACDYRYASAGRVLVGVPEILLGVPNPFFADQLLRFVTSDAFASDVIYSGRLVAAEACVGAGLVHHVADKATVEDEAWRKALDLAALPRAAFAASKSMRTEALCARIEHDLARWIEVLLDAWTGPDARDRLHAAAARLRKTG